jgi:hypothetical protein
VVEHLLVYTMPCLDPQHHKTDFKIVVSFLIFRNLELESHKRPKFNAYKLNVPPFILKTGIILILRIR